MANSFNKPELQLGSSARLLYLSWSKMQLWKKDPNLFYQVYIEGLDQFRTKYLELGKKLAKALEGDEEILRNDPMMRYMKAMMPAYDKPEHELKGTWEGVPLKGFPDSFNSKTFAFREYKSGKKWTQSMANRHGQLKFYALLIYIKHKKLPPEVWLDWAKTREEEETGELVLTGDITSFKVVITMADVIRMGGEVIKTWREIQDFLKFMKKT